MGVPDGSLQAGELREIEGRVWRRDGCALGHRSHADNDKITAHETLLQGDSLPLTRERQGDGATIPKARVELTVREIVREAKLRQGETLGTRERPGDVQRSIIGHGQRARTVVVVLDGRVIEGGVQLPDGSQTYERRQAASDARDDRPTGPVGETNHGRAEIRPVPAEVSAQRDLV